MEDLFRNTGFADVQSQIIRSPLNLPTAEDALQMIQQAFGAYRAIVADLSADDQAAAWSEVLECLRQFESKDGFETKFEFVIASGAARGSLRAPVGGGDTPAAEEVMPSRATSRRSNYN